MLNLFSCIALAAGSISELEPKCVLSVPEQRSSVDSKPFRFVAVGDMPYSQAEIDFLRGDLKTAIAKAQVPFVVHYGDFKPGNGSCSDQEFQKAKDDISGLHDTVFYTPGDNDWTDCDRKGLVMPRSELDALMQLRQIFFADPEPSSIPVERQVNYPENARWWYQGVLFSTVHVVGTQNGRAQILKDNPKQAIAAVEQRDQANTEWLEATFNQAQTSQAQAVVVVMQGDLSETSASVPCSPERPKNCDPYPAYRDRLIKAAAKFRDEDLALKPVLLIHGDTAPFCWNKTFGGEQAPNLWRFNAWGDFQTPTDATVIDVNLEDKTAPFQAQTLVNAVQPAIQCD